MNSNLNHKTLILFTANYPFGTGEVFLEKELRILSQNFKSIVIVSSDVSNTVAREVPGNVKVLRHSVGLSKFDKLKSLLLVFNKEFKKEYQLIKHLGSEHSEQQVRYLLSSLFNGKRVERYIESLVLKNSIDKKELVLYSYWWLDEAVGISLYKKKNPSVLAFSRCHGYDVYAERSACDYLPLKRMTMHYLDRIFAISSNAKQYILENYIDNKDWEKKIEVSRLGVDHGELQFLKSGENKKSFTIVSCSSIYPNKRIDVILNAVLASDQYVKWVHIGTYIENFSEKYYEKILTSVQSNSKKNITIELLGNLSNEAVLNYYKTNEIDLFINASASEGISVAIMEAMSCAIPVIATNVGGTSELVNETNGILVNGNIDAKELQVEIDNFFNLDSEKVRSLRQSAFNTIETDYNAQKNYNQFINQIVKISS